METRLQKSTKGWLPYVIGALLVVQFVGLGTWQVNRAIEKRASQEAFEEPSGFTRFVDGMDVRPYQRLSAEGKFDAAHQFLLDNIILDGRYGHYVLTPLVYSDEEPVLIVNRGWIERSVEGVDPSAIDVPEDQRVSVRGRVGSLPRAGYRMGAAIESSSTWPRHAVYPTLDELAAALGREVQPFILLMEPEEKHGLLRHWVPEEMGPARHYAYAFQWFAMGLVLAGLLLWNFRKRGYRR
ncbi:MAG TPA: SURF1 family protein [Woeseiaceae bacterium]|nr:SURF1 family protein [Woeseiaceae bacterium]